MTKCPICDYENSEGEKYCRSCGASMDASPPSTKTEEVPTEDKEKTSKVCPKCATENLIAAKFCKSCGESLGDEKPSEEEPPKAKSPPLEDTAPKEESKEKPSEEEPPKAEPLPLEDTAPKEESKEKPSEEKLPKAEPPPPKDATTSAEESKKESKGPEVLFCPHCKVENIPNSKFCKACGKPLKEEEPVPEEPSTTTTPEQKCPKCGATVHPGVKFCGECGASLKEEPEPSGPRLIINPYDKDTRKVFALDKAETFLGREEDVNIRLEDGYVSSKHAVLKKKDGGFWIEDLGSTNFSFIRITGETRLKAGDEIKIGQTIIRFEE